ncbi:hypothetical protein [Aeoliella sp.]|uniref:hypothetical protein n=1 Tax=Aeoliella sp. TaxID=2795800 RepID=UPI003CCBE709
MPSSANPHSLPWWFWIVFALYMLIAVLWVTLALICSLLVSPYFMYRAWKRDQLRRQYLKGQGRLIALKEATQRMQSGEGVGVVEFGPKGPEELWYLDRRWEELDVPETYPTLLSCLIETEVSLSPTDIDEERNRDWLQATLAPLFPKLQQVQGGSHEVLDWADNLTSRVLVIGWGDKPRPTSHLLEECGV